MQKTMLSVYGMVNLLALLLVTGCTSMRLDSNKDEASVHKIQKLFIVINHGEVKSQPLSQDLSEGFKGCLTNATPQIEIAITSPLDLDESSYKARMTSFGADAVLVVSVNTFVLDEFGGYPTILYDASLYNPDMKKRIWRSAIRNSGGTALMKRRMREMASSIVLKLQTDGFLDAH